MNQRSILLVDDDSDLLEMLGERCRSVGLHVEHAHNLLTAMRLIDKRVPDVICVDVNMPTGNGLRFCETLTADPATAAVPIIVLSGQQTADIPQTCARLGLHFLAKRADVWPALEQLLRELLEGNRPAAKKTAGLQPRPLPERLIPPLPTTANEEAGMAAAAVRVTKQIVVADDDYDLVHFLGQRFAALGCSVIGASSAIEAINAIHRITPDLVVLDVNMPGGNGLSVCEMMSTDERLRTTPVIILTGRTDESTIRRCHDMLVFYVAKGSTIWSRIEPLVCELLHLATPPLAWKEPPTARDLAHPLEHHAKPTTSGGARSSLVDTVFEMLGGGAEAAATATSTPNAGAAISAHDTGSDEPPWVLCIDDDADFSDALRMRFEQHGVAVVRAFNGMEGYRMAFTSPAAAIMLDYNMPNGQGDYVLDRLKANPVTRDIPVFILTGTKDKMLERRMMAMGAAGYFYKPVDFDSLRRNLSRHIDILSAPAPPVTAMASS